MRTRRRHDAVHRQPVCSSGVGAPPGSAAWNRAVKWNVLPCPNSLSTQIRPPIKWTRLEAMASPSPVPPILPRRGSIGLGEGREDPRLVVRRDADSRIRHGELQEHLRGLAAARSSGGAQAGHAHRHFALRRELDRVADQVRQDLAESQRIADQPIRQVLRQIADQLQALLAGPDSQRLERLVQGRAEAERDGFQLEPAGLDAGEIEDFVEQLQQPVRGFLGRLQVVPDGGVQIRAQGQVGHAQDRRHRRPQLVADVGQELVLGDVGRFGRPGVLLRGFQQADPLHGDRHLVGHGSHQFQFVLAKRDLVREPNESVPITRPWFKSGWQA